MIAIESLQRRAAAAAWVLLLALCAPAAAQQTPAPPPAEVGFLTRYDFHLTGMALLNDDPRFVSDAHFGGDLDIVDYVKGRTSIAVDYEAVLGNQFRAFDPNQGNYILEVSSSARAGQTEIVGVFHHESRHLSDRPKLFAIAWNTFGVRALRSWDIKGTTVEGTIEAAKVVAYSYVDYAWTSQADLRIRHPLASKADVYLRGTAEVFGIDETLSTRLPPTSHTSGGLVEAGVRLKGRAGIIELFAGYEKRIDADPLDFTAQHWGIAGFRLVNR